MLLCFMSCLEMTIMSSSYYVEFVAPTAQEEQRIRQGDRELIDKYYFANRALIENVAKRFCIRHNVRLREGLWEDIMQEVYLHFSKLKFTAKYTFVRTLMDVGVYVLYGTETTFHQLRQSGCVCLTIIDAPCCRDMRHGGISPTFGDTLQSPHRADVQSEDDYTEDIYKVLKKYLTDKQARVYWYFLYYDNITAREIANELCLNMNTVQSLKRNGLLALRKHSKEIYSDLVASNCLPMRFVKDS